MALAFMHLYGIFNLIVFVHSFLLFLTFGIETADRNGQWYQHISELYLPFLFFMKAIPKRLTFGLCLYLLCLYHVHVLHCSPDSPNDYYMLLV